MAIDPMIERTLDQFGFAEVLVAVKQDGAAAAAAASATAASAAASASAASVLRHFLAEIPVAAGGLAAATAAASVSAATADRPAAARVAAEAAVAAAPPAARYFPRLGVAIGYVERDGVQALANDPAVADVVHADQPSLIRPVGVRAARGRAALTWGLRRLGIEAFWQQGLTGQGIRVGHLDTGVDGRHPALQGRLAAYALFDFDGEAVPGAAPTDSDSSFGHGTHTAATICGGVVDGVRLGVAPEATLCSATVIEGGRILLRITAGMEWILDQGVQVLNMSLGIRGFSPAFLALTRAIRDNGVLPVFAIGNEGVGTSRSPGNYAEALSVGMTDRRDRVDSRSSSMVFQRPIEPIQPNIVAPGVGIISAKPGGGVRSLDGTSMATPHVSGVAALLFQARPGATVDAVQAAIEGTCQVLPGELPSRQGFGLIDPAAALRALLAG